MHQSWSCYLKRCYCEKVALHWSLWHTVKSVQCKRWVKLIVVCVCASKVDHGFVGETERHLLVTNTVCTRICPFHQRVGEIDLRSGNWGQFHQHYTNSFYTCRSQKRKKLLELSVFFSLLESACIKAACKMLVKLTPGLKKKPYMQQKEVISEAKSAF